MLPPEEENPSMYVLSNADKLNGAAALLDAKTMEDISEKLGGDFVVLPSSIHETIVLPLNEDMDRHTLEAMVQDVNAGQVAPEERLSDHVYMYDSQAKELVLADKMEERQQQRAEAQKDAKEAEQADKPGKAERGEKKPERERVSMKEKLPEKKAEVAKNEASREHPVPSKTKETALG
jgi:regulator of protease activity HflC (stomatin/prohibitin superfamily)